MEKFSVEAIAKEIVDKAREHAFFLLFSLALFIAGASLGVSAPLFTSLFFTSLLPGYLLLLLLAEQSEVERAVMAFPAGVVFTGAVTMVPHILFDVRSVHWSVVGFAEVVLLALLWRFGSKKTIPEAGEKKLAALALASAALVFGAQLLSFGWFSQSVPPVQSIDGVSQVVQIAWVARNGDYSLAPAFNPQGGEFYAVPALSMVTQAVATQLRAASSWNVNSVFQAFLLVTMVLGLLLFFEKLAGFHAAVVAAAAALLPPALEYVAPFQFNLWRTTFTMALLPLILYSSVKFSQERTGGAARVLALLVLLLASVHLVDLVIVAIPLAFVVASVLSARLAREQVLKTAAVAGVLFAVLVLPHAVHYSPANQLSPFSSLPLFSLSFNAEQAFGWAVGPMLVRLQQTPAWVAVACLLAVGLLAAARESKHDAAEDALLHFAGSLCTLFVTTSGILPFLSLYVLTQRYVLYAAFLLPLAGAGIFLACAAVFEKARVASGYAAVVSIALLSLLAAPWAYDFPTKDEHPLPGSAWEVLSFLGRNSSLDSKVLFLNYFLQQTGCLSARTCSEVPEEEFLRRVATSNYSRAIAASPVCKEAVRRTGFLSFTPVKCEAGFDYNNVCSYDYVVIGHAKPYDAYLAELEKRMEPTFATAYAEGVFTVHKRVRLNEKCL